MFDNIRRNYKDLYLVGNFNINILGYEINVKIRNFVNIAFEITLIPLSNKPTRVTRTNTTAIDHIRTNGFLNKRESSKRESSKLKFLIIAIFLITDRITSSEVKKNTPL